MATVYVITGPPSFFFFGRGGCHGAYLLLVVSLKEKVGSAMWSALGLDTALTCPHCVYLGIFTVSENICSSSNSQG